MEQELTFGQKAVGLTFNPSGDDKVAKAKQLFADVIDIMCPNGGGDIINGEFNLSLHWTLRQIAFSAIIAAQMAVVKYLTWKD